ncbi:hypothetical protein BX265_7920 [Streptomyces sp. TLI_235]|nr:hypothetical protein [Streptomyces sp. TLI_235]PBC70493.1 hypothetical protein BX265_7920 [Streptomyces sp. TLI_235]
MTTRHGPLTGGSRQDRVWPGPGAVGRRDLPSLGEPPPAIAHSRRALPCPDSSTTADFSWGASNVYHGGPLRPGDVVLLHFTDTLATDLARVLAAADAAGLRPAGLADYLP